MKINFHILDNSNQQQAWLYACKLIEQAYADQQAIYIHTSSRQEADKLDDLLWTFKDDSFVPHSVVEAGEENPPLVQIGFTNPPENQQNLLINLSSQVPGFYKQFNELIEIVFSDPSVQQLARERYKHYRDNGEELNTIKN